jgi:hypothetical protein
LINFSTMALPFFPDNWAEISKEDLTTCRARLSGFIEAVTEKDKDLKEVFSIANI